jgi:hypothetical protein
MRYLIIFVPLLAVNSACKDDGPEETRVSYQHDIRPIIEAKCYRCHSSTATDPERPGYAFFDDFDQLRHYALKKSVYDPSYTTLQARLRYIETPGMPLNDDPLPENEIQLIEAWISAGAPNN